MGPRVGTKKALGNSSYRFSAPPVQPNDFSQDRGECFGQVVVSLFRSVSQSANEHICVLLFSVAATVHQSDVRFLVRLRLCTDTGSGIMRRERPTQCFWTRQPREICIFGDIHHSTEHRFFISTTNRAARLFFVFSPGRPPSTKAHSE